MQVFRKSCTARQRDANDHPGFPHLRDCPRRLPAVSTDAGPSERGPARMRSARRAPSSRPASRGWRCTAPTPRSRRCRTCRRHVRNRTVARRRNPAPGHPAGSMPRPSMPHDTSADCACRHRSSGSPSRARHARYPAETVPPGRATRPAGPNAGRHRSGSAPRLPGHPWRTAGPRPASRTGIRCPHRPRCDAAPWGAPASAELVSPWHPRSPRPATRNSQVPRSNGTPCQFSGGFLQDDPHREAVLRSPAT